MKPPIVLKAYNPEWFLLFEEERSAMERLDRGWFKEIHHVGSTSIPGIRAKPIIDILVSLHRNEDGLHCVEAMRELGYEYRGDGGIPGRHYFRKGDPHTHHVHMWAADHPELGRHLQFRDYLRSHPDWAQSYEALKRQLAEKFGADTYSYSLAKNEFCARIDELALSKDRKA